MLGRSGALRARRASSEEHKNANEHPKNGRNEKDESDHDDRAAHAKCLARGERTLTTRATDGVLWRDWFYAGDGRRRREGWR
jgi:hypothetical protein